MSEKCSNVVPYSEYEAMREERDCWARMYMDLANEYQQYKRTHPACIEEDFRESCIFTKKAKIEHKEAEIISSLSISMQGRKDKGRALIAKLRYWQDEGYIDRHYNAQILYDELGKLLSLPFNAANFRKFYHQWSAVAK